MDFEKTSSFLYVFFNSEKTKTKIIFVFFTGVVGGGTNYEQLL